MLGNTFHVWNILRILEGLRQKKSLNDCDHNSNESRILIDLLLTTFFTAQLRQGWHHSRHQLHHNRSRDIRHDTQSKDPALLERASGKHVQENSDCITTFIIFHPPLEPTINDAGIYSRESDRHAEADDHNHGKREQNPVPKLGNLPDVSECRDHVLGIREM